MIRLRVCWVWLLPAVLLHAALTVWIVDVRVAAVATRPIARNTTPPSADNDDSEAWRVLEQADAYQQARHSPSVLSRRIQSTQRPRQANGRPFYIVFSPESNGNRYMVSLLLSAGCYGHADHVQPLDDRRTHGREWPNHLLAVQRWPNTAYDAPCLALHRSVPHNGVWPRLESLLAEIRAADWQPRILVMLRPEDVAKPSQVRRKHVRNEHEAEKNIRHAQRHIISALANEPDLWFRLVLYEELRHDHYVKWLFDEQLQLQLPSDYPRFEDRDSKHLRGH